MANYHRAPRKKTPSVVPEGSVSGAHARGRAIPSSRAGKCRSFDAYLRLLRRWRWSLLLTILVGTFLLQPLWPPTPLGELVTFTLAMLIFGGAIYAGRKRQWVGRPLVGLLMLATAAAAPRVRRRAAASKARCRRPRAGHRRGGDGRDLRRAPRQPRRDRRRPRRRDLRLPADRRRLVAAFPPARNPAPRLVRPRSGRPRHPTPLLQPDHHHHGRLRRRAAAQRRSPGSGRRWKRWSERSTLPS